MQSVSIPINESALYYFIVRGLVFLLWSLCLKIQSLLKLRRSGRDQGVPDPGLTDLGCLESTILPGDISRKHYLDNYHDDDVHKASEALLFLSIPRKKARSCNYQSHYFPNQEGSRGPEASKKLFADVTRLPSPL